jgi:hypothetical protein
MANKSKQKGNAFEYDCQASLKQIMPDIYRTSERGYQMQYDLRSEKENSVFECKRLKAITWNSLEKFYRELENLVGKPKAYLLFQSNFQPCLVFYRDFDDHHLHIKRFEDVFNVPFIKHESSRRK